MLSKSLGHILRVSAVMHVLFHMDIEEPLPDTITEMAIEAAIDLVELCCQHTAYITGRGNINNELDIVEAGTCKYYICNYMYFVYLKNSPTCRLVYWIDTYLFVGSAVNLPTTNLQPSNEAFVLSLPGKILDVSLLVNRKKKFRARGGRDGALDAMQRLEEDGMGKLVLKKSKGLRQKVLANRMILLLLQNV